jgi:hypothetical protein
VDLDLWAGFFFFADGFELFFRAGLFLLAAMKGPFDMRAMCPSLPKIAGWSNGLTREEQSEC